MIGPEVTAPDLTEAVIAYRRFHLVKRSQHNYHLVSPHTNEPWPTVERTAKCNRVVESKTVALDGIRPKLHSAPHKDCGCGIYAYFEPCPVSEESDMWWRGSTGPPATEVAALVTMTGRIEAHARGMRSHRARICALGTHQRLSADERAALAAIAEGFGVPVVAQADLPRLAGEYGSPLPVSLRPAVPEPAVARTDSPVDEAVRMAFGSPASTPTRPRVSRWSVGFNGSAALLNVGAALVFQSWLNIVVGTGCAAYTGWLARGAR